MQQMRENLRGNRPKILVVDDVLANRIVLRRLLARMDADVVEADSGSAGLAACLDHDFALILLDVNMPGMDGFEVALLLRGAEQTRRVPIIFVTAGGGDDANRLKGYSLGAVDYITKPVNDVVLLAKVQVFLDLYRSRSDLSAANELLMRRNEQLQIEITERKNAEENARHQATHDPLTGLPNRIFFIDRIETTIERARRDLEPFALAYIDIDGFKTVNDLYGHQAGDELLKAIAGRLRQHVRTTDTVSRLGGDEFAVILGGSIGSAKIALSLCTQLWEALRQPYRLPSLNQPIDVAVGASVGIAMYPEHGREIDPLIHAADSAMYLAKNAGKNHCQLATSGPDETKQPR